MLWGVCMCVCVHVSVQNSSVDMHRVKTHTSSTWKVTVAGLNPGLSSRPFFQSPPLLWIWVNLAGAPGPIWSRAGILLKQTSLSFLYTHTHTHTCAPDPTLRCQPRKSRDVGIAFLSPSPGLPLTQLPWEHLNSGQCADLTFLP